MLVGTDEAGYGPNLGPLVIAATQWSAEPAARDFLRDSKKLYHSGGSLARLEAACLGGMLHLGHPVTTYKNLCELLAQTSTQIITPFWERNCDIAIPRAATQKAIDHAARELHDFAGVSLRFVFPEEFNSIVSPETNKSTLLSRATLTLVADALPEYGDVFVRCDKHGGRNKYTELLSEHIESGKWVTVSESLMVSEYHLSNKTSSKIFVFCAKGESFPEIALASLYAKYCRELSMRLFNNFWQAHIAGLAPTAGYPVDAHRFREEIAQSQHSLGITDAELWRER